TVLVAGERNAVTNVVVDAQEKTVTLTLTRPVTAGQTTTVAYSDSTPGDTSGIQDVANNRLGSFQATTVSVSDTSAPVLITEGAKAPKVNASTLVLSFEDAGNLNADASRKPASEDFTVLV
ncbi:SwmB domain-containing protein, partial [Verminephrobacter aporrectodeae]|uniref:SwmB domain-containing protein n=1 Tax=Verminephrobacter aporrectodeae TaxID=1110389 RepID=UPI0002377B04